jgi:N-acetylglucosamine-6-phosphate deacetylase
LADATLVLVNARVLAGDAFLEGHAVLIRNGRILDVVPEDDARCAQARREDLGGARLLPGFIDIQVNGGGGMLFNDAPAVETIRGIACAHRRFGTTGFLPTLISDDLAVVERGIGAVRQAMEAGVPGVLGIHIEGPFLSPERRGIHNAAKLRTLEPAAVRLLSSLGTGRTLVTLAPEAATPELIGALVKAGVIVSAGHTNASYAQVQAALAQGLSCFTHLFNAMSQITAREPGVVGAALDDPHSWCGIIVDGEHASPVVLRIAMRAKPGRRFVLVTDAMPSLGTRARTFQLQGRTITVKGHSCLDEDGRLAGSNIDMASCVRNTVRLLGVPLPEAVRMASLHPAQLLGLAGELGSIAPGQRACLTLVDEGLRVIDTWIDGRRTSGAEPSRRRQIAARVSGRRLRARSRKT